MPNSIKPSRTISALALTFFCSTAIAGDMINSSEEGRANFMAADRASINYNFLGPAFSYHQQRTHANRPYNETHPGLGIEQRALLAAHPNWERRLSLSVMNDSFNKPSIFAQATLLRRIGHIGGIKFLTGATSGFAYKQTKWEGPRQLVPLLGASFAVSPKSGLGLNTTYVYKRNKNTGNTSGIFTIQTSYDF